MSKKIFRRFNFCCWQKNFATKISWIVSIQGKHFQKCVRLKLIWDWFRPKPAQKGCKFSQLRALKRCTKSVWVHFCAQRGTTIHTKGVLHSGVPFLLKGSTVHSFFFFQSYPVSEAIQSRCAILRYSKLSDAQILKRLLQVCDKEQVGLVS